MVGVHETEFRAELEGPVEQRELENKGFRSVNKNINLEINLLKGGASYSKLDLRTNHGRESLTQRADWLSEFVT